MMAKDFKYTTLAHRYTAKFPMLTYVGIQTNFWIVANILLVSIVHLQSLVTSHAFNVPVAGRFGPLVLPAVISGVLYGTTLGLISYYLDHRIFKKQTLGKVILLKTSYASEEPFF